MSMARYASPVCSSTRGWTIARLVLRPPARESTAVRALRPASLVALCAALSACGNRGASNGAASSTAPAPRPSGSALPPAGPATPLGPVAGAAIEPNPLHLPPVRVTLDRKQRVFTFPEQMLAAARPGSTLVLYAATVTSVEGDDFIVESKGAPSYKVHQGYVIAVPDVPRLRPGDAVLTEHNGMMKHAVVTRFVKDRVGVRYTDLQGRAQEALLLPGSKDPPPALPGKPAPSAPKPAWFVKQAEGLAPGNYAALRRGGEWTHVLLVSASGEGDARRWFALGYGGAAMVVAEGDLAPIPIKPKLKLGAAVWAESGGKMRRATVQAADDQGLFSVKFERAGRPSTVGWGLVMKPLAE